MSDPNYFNIPYSSLPSLGKLYPEYSSIRFRILQIRDLKYLASMNETNSTELVNDMIRRCVRTEGFAIDDLYKMDRLSIIFYLRRNTFMLSNGYQTEFNCPYCGDRVRKSFQIHELAKREIDKSVLRKIYIDGIEISGRYQKIFEPVHRTDDPDIDMILDCTDIEEIMPYMSVEELKSKILNLPADQYSKLKHLASDAMCGILSYTNLECDSCFKKMRVGVDLSDEKLFNRVYLTTLIRNQIQVSKFCGLTITDDMPYNEVELMVSIVNDMIRKEAEAINRAKGRSQR
jgi:hypothetical protein